MSYVKKDGTARLRIIAPGWGSSGYYSEAVLQNAASLFKKGVKGFWDHPTADEEKAKPEGSLSNLSHELIEDAQYIADDPNGPGLYANVKFFRHFKDAVNELGPYIGNSIRATGKARMGEIDGRKGAIIESIIAVRSVDMVTMPGAKGKPVALTESTVLELFEAAKTTVTPPVIEKDTHMADNEDLNALRVLVEAQNTQIARLNERMALSAAQLVISSQLRHVQLPAATKARLAQSLMNTTTLTENGTLDTAALTAAIETAVKSEAEYLSQLGSSGINIGSSVVVNSLQSSNEDITKLTEAVNAAINDL